MKTAITAGFETPDEAAAALGRLNRSGIDFRCREITDISPAKITDGGWDSGSVRLGSYKSLFSIDGDSDLPSPDVFQRGTRLTVETDRKNKAEVSQMLRNSHALGISILT